MRTHLAGFSVVAAALALASCEKHPGPPTEPSPVLSPASSLSPAVTPPSTPVPPSPTPSDTPPKSPPAPPSPTPSDTPPKSPPAPPSPTPSDTPPKSPPAPPSPSPSDTLLNPPPAPSPQSANGDERPSFSSRSANEYVQSYDEYIEEFKLAYQAMKRGDMSKYQVVIQRAHDLESKAEKLSGDLTADERMRFAAYLDRKAGELADFTSRNK